MPKTSSDITFLKFLLRHLLLLFGLECHISIVLCTAVHSRGSCAAHIAASDAAVEATSRERSVLKTVGRNSQVALMRYPTIDNVPLLGTKSTDELFVVGNHNDAASIITNGHSKATKGVAVQKVSRLIKDK